MKNHKTHAIAASRLLGLALAAAILGLLASCGAVDGTLVLSLAQDRTAFTTILPAAITTADEYDVVLGSTTYTQTDLAKPITGLVPGSYALLVRAYSGTGGSRVLVASSDSGTIDIKVGDNNIVVTLKPTQTTGSGTGTLKAVFTWPDGPDQVTWSVTDMGTNAQLEGSQFMALDSGYAGKITQDLVGATNSMTVNGLVLGSGNYWFRLHFWKDADKDTVLDADEEYAIITLGTQIYDNLASGNLVTPIAITADDLSQVPEAPTTLAYQAFYNPQDTGNLTFTFTWEDNSLNEIGYRIYKGTTLVASTSMDFAKVTLSSSEFMAMAADFSVVAVNRVGESAPCTVQYVPATGVTLSENTYDFDIDVGGSHTLTATLPAASGSAYPQSVTWVSDKPGVVQVVNGELYPVKPGVATITGYAPNGYNQSCVVTVRGLVVAWDFENMSTGGLYSPVPPNTGNADFILNPNTSDGSVRIVSDESLGRVLDLSNSGSYNRFATIGDTTSGTTLAQFADQPAPWTVSAWIMVKNSAAVSQALVSQSTGWAGLRVKGGTSPTVYGVTNSSDMSYAVNSPGADIWQHVAFVNDGSRIDLYVNGVSAGSLTETSAYGLGLPMHIIGAASGGLSDLFGGYVDELRFYNKALGATAVAALPNISTRFFAGGIGTDVGNPYLVSTPVQLNHVRYFPERAYSQTADITNLSTSYSDWTPIAGFTGTYDGNLHYIGDLASSQGGLFGSTSGATLTEIRLKNASVNASTGNVGLLVNQATNTAISRSSSSGSVSSSGSGIGGLVGDVSGGTISQSYSTASVQGYEKVGGLVGNNNGGSNVAISDCYATGAVTGTGTDNYVIAGLLGSGNGSSGLSNSYATGAVTASSAGQGLVGYTGASVTSAYFDLGGTGVSSSYGGGTAKSTSAILAQATYTGWDFASTWSITEGVSFPWLQWQVEDTAAIPKNPMVRLSLENNSNDTAGFLTAPWHGIENSVAYDNNSGYYQEGAYSVFFDGSTSYVSVGTGQTLPAEFTITMWIMPGSNASDAMLFSNQGGSANAPGFSLYLSASATIGVQMGNGSTSGTSTDGTTLTSSVWHHVALTKASDGTMRLYVNKSNGNSADYLDGISLASIYNGPFYLGSYLTSGGKYAGYIDDFRIYPRVLSAAEITALTP